MRWEIIVVILFWLIYGPISFVIWGYTSSHLIDLIAILGAGVGFTFMFLSVSLLTHYITKMLRKKSTENIIEIPEEEGEEEPEADSEELAEALEEDAPVPHIEMLPVKEHTEEYDLD